MGVKSPVRSAVTVVMSDRKKDSYGLTRHDEIDYGRKSDPDFRRAFFRTAGKGNDVPEDACHHN